MRIGVLALQGAFEEHIKMLEKLNVETFEIRNKDDLKKMDGLIIPGGESTVIGKLLYDLDLFYGIKDLIDNGMPVFGTCAGMILLAKKISNDDKVYLNALDIVVKRNAYGRQLGSFITKSYFKGIGEIEHVFIRGPFVESVGKNVEVLSTVDDKIVAVKEENILATAFHPELTNDTRIHEYFLKMIEKSRT